MKNEYLIKCLAAYLPHKIHGWGNRHRYTLVAVSIEQMDGFWMIADDYQVFSVYGKGSIKPVLYQLELLLSDIDILESELGGKMSDAIHDWIKYAGSDHANIDNAILCAPYPVIEWALEKHYDIFSLIPKGLAMPLT
jgi:hypothetical protein